MVVEIQERKATIDFQQDMLAVFANRKEMLSAYDIHTKLTLMPRYKEWARTTNPEWRKFYSRVVVNVRALAKKNELKFVKQEEGFGSIKKSLYQRV